jgi:alkylation response protein AidB-like acyl-CoA dehydrogenase
MSREVEALDAAKSFLKNEVAPKAQLIDRDADALREIVDRMGELDLLALKRPARYGGPEMSEPLFRVYQEEVARTSGTLAFLTTQHQSAVGMIAGGENDALKDLYLPKMGSGERLVGIGFSQLRRSGPPIMRAERVEGGYELNGHVPWVTGWSFFAEFLIGASLPDGESVFAVVPLADVMDDASQVCVSPPMELAAMGTAMTVTVDFNHFLVPNEKVAFTRPAGWIKNSDSINIALQGHFAIGCAMAGIDIVRENVDKKPFMFLSDTLDSLEKELAALRMATASAQKSSDDATTPERLKVRAWAIDFAVRCAHAAITCSSGAANSLQHPAQRVYREALVYTVSAQTPAVMESTLQRLVSRGGW